MDINRKDQNRVKVNFLRQQSIFAETFATQWQHWLVAKLFSGVGVGMLQSTLPLYLSEISPTQLRGFFINAYTL
jgi:MFS family permease